MVAKHYIGGNFDINYWPVIKRYVGGNLNRLHYLSGHSPVVVHAHRAVACSGLGLVVSKKQGRDGPGRAVDLVCSIKLNNGVGTWKDRKWRSEQRAVPHRSLCNLIPWRPPPTLGHAVRRREVAVGGQHPPPPVLPIDRPRRRRRRPCSQSSSNSTLL
jgi:hypothetical protein